MFNFLSRLNPVKISQGALRVNWDNILYMGSAAILSRLLVAAARITLNRPGRKDIHADYTPYDRFAGFAERINIEGVGTVAYMAAINMATDLYAKLAESAWLKPPTFNERNLPANTANAAAIKKTIDDTVVEFFSSTPSVAGNKGKLGGMIYREAFDGTFKRKIEDAGTTFYSLLNERLNQFTIQDKHVIVNQMTDQVKALGVRLRKNTLASVLMGVVAGFTTGGILIQLYNDRWFAPVAIPRLAQWFGYEKPKKPFDSKTEPTADSKALRKKGDVTPIELTQVKPFSMRPKEALKDQVRTRYSPALQEFSSSNFSSSPAPNPVSYQGRVLNVLATPSIMPSPVANQPNPNFNQALTQHIASQPSQAVYYQTVYPKTLISPLPTTYNPIRL